jgi:hypothetical protein
MMTMTQSLITSEGVSAKKIGHLIEAGGALQERFGAVVIDLLAKLTNTYLVVVDYGKTLAEMARAGEYNYANENITADNFPVKGSGQVPLEIVLVHYAKDMESEDVLADLDKMGLRAARIEELLAFGATHKDVQRQFPIIALGSVWTRPLGNRDVPYLGHWFDERGLDLDIFGNRWNDHCRFAAVRK